MRIAVSFLAAWVVIINLLLGARGFWKEDHDFFTMHPFSDPAVHCEITASSGEQEIALPDQLYRGLQPSFDGRIYLELLPLYKQGIKQFLQETHPDAEVSITCETLFGPPQTFSS